MASIDVEPRQSRWVACFWILALFVALRPFPMQLQGLNPNSLATEGGRPFDFYLILAVALLALPALVSRWTAVWEMLRANPFLPAFLFLSVLSSAWSSDPYLTARTAAGLFCTIVIVLGAGAVMGPRELPRIVMFVLLLALVLSAVVALASPAYGVQRADFAGNFAKWRGVFAQKNHLGMVSAFAAMAFVCCGPQLLRRPIWIFGLLMATLCIVMSRSGSGIVLTISGLMFYVMLFRLSKIYRYFAFFFIALLMPLLITYGQDFLVFGTGMLGRDESFTGRTYLWEAGFKLWLEHPVGGQGLAAFSSAYVANVFAAAAVASGHGAVTDPHNAYLFLGITLGGIGVFLLLATIAVAFARIARLGRTLEEQSARRLAALFLFLWVVAGTVESAPFWSGTPEFMLGICGLIAAACCRQIGKQQAPVVTAPHPPPWRRPRPQARARR